MTAEKVAWSEAEDRVLSETYPLHGCDWDGWERVLPGRSVSAIRTRANRLLVRKPRQRGVSWTEDEERRLLVGVISLSKALDRSPMAVIRHAESLVRGAPSRIRLKESATESELI